MLEVTEQTKDASSKKSNFKLKPQYLGWFDPYFYLSPESQSQIMEAISNMKAERNQLDEVIGDVLANYPYKTEVNQVIREALAQSSIISYLSEILVLWA